MRKFQFVKVFWKFKREKPRRSKGHLPLVTDFIVVRQLYYPTSVASISGFIVACQQYRPTSTASLSDFLSCQLHVSNL